MIRARSHVRSAQLDRAARARALEERSSPEQITRQCIVIITSMYPVSFLWSEAVGDVAQVREQVGIFEYICRVDVLLCRSNRSLLAQRTQLFVPNS